MVVARALLRSAEGERPGIDVPISAGNMARLAPRRRPSRPSPTTSGRAGFGILGRPGITIGISGSKELFERHFGIELALRCRPRLHAFEPRSRSGQPPDRTDDPAFPKIACRGASGRLISQIALETAVSIDQQPETDR